MTQDLTRRTALALMAAATGSAAFAQEAAVESPVIQEFALGDPNAPIEVVEYASFTSPHCATFHDDVFPELKANFIDTGKIRFIFRPVYFDAPGLWADMLARCTGDNDKYFRIADILFVSQAEWFSAGTQATYTARMVDIGNMAGIDEETVLACLQDHDYGRALFDDFEVHAKRDGISTTPSFMIDGELTSNMSYASFAQLLNQKLGE